MVVGWLNSTLLGIEIDFVLCFEFTGQAGIRSRYAKVTVLVPPESPQISQGSFMWATEGDEIELECTAKGGKPAAEVISIPTCPYLGTIAQMHDAERKTLLRSTRIS